MSSNDDAPVIMACGVPDDAPPELFEALTELGRAAAAAEDRRRAALSDEERADEDARRAAAQRRIHERNARLRAAHDKRECTCGPGVWGTCDQCGADAWVHHHCGFPCDDVTCEDGSLCIGCLTGRPCPVHNDWDGDDA